MSEWESIWEAGHRKTFSMPGENIRLEAQFDSPGKPKLRFVSQGLASSFSEEVAYLVVDVGEEQAKNLMFHLAAHLGYREPLHTSTDVYNIRREQWEARDRLNEKLKERLAEAHARIRELERSTVPLSPDQIIQAEGDAW